MYRYLVSFNNRNYEVDAHSRAEALTVAEERVKNDEQLTNEKRCELLRGHVSMYMLYNLEEPPAAYQVKVEFIGTHDEGIVYGKDKASVLNRARSYIDAWAIGNALNPRPTHLLLYDKGKLVHKEEF